MSCLRWAVPGVAYKGALYHARAAHKKKLFDSHFAASLCYNVQKQFCITMPKGRELQS